jgi:ORF6N domain
MKPKKPIETLILNIRNQKVILDADLAELYGVPTKVFNQAVKRNFDRFPADFSFQLTAAEVANLRSQFVTSSVQSIGIQKDTPNSSQFVTSSYGGRRYRPWAFPESLNQRDCRTRCGCPWQSPKADLDKTRQLIKDCGYGRRKEELEDAEKLIRSLRRKSL